MLTALCHFNFISPFFFLLSADQYICNAFLLLLCTHPFFPLLHRRQHFLHTTESLYYENAIKFMTLFIFSFCSFRYYYSLLFQYFNMNSNNNSIKRTIYSSSAWCVCVFARVCIGLEPTSPVIFNKLCLSDKFSTIHFRTDSKSFYTMRCAHIHTYMVWQRFHESVSPSINSRIVKTNP